MRRLVKFRGDGGYYMLDLIGIKVLDEKQWGFVQRALEESLAIPLGEIEGKHSDVTWHMDEPEEFVVLGTEDHVDMFLELFPSGFVGNIDMFEYIEEHYEKEDAEQG